MTDREIYDLLKEVEKRLGDTSRFSNHRSLLNTLDELEDYIRENDQALHPGERQYAVITVPIGGDKELTELMEMVVRSTASQAVSFLLRQGEIDDCLPWPADSAAVKKFADALREYCTEEEDE